MAGDTLVPRRKRKRKAKGQGLRAKGGVGPEPNDDEIEYIPVEELEAGDEILSLDENTGRFVWQRVNALMDKGIKAIVKLTTASGKTIKTTSEHPYLVNVEAENRKMAFAFIDEVGASQDVNQPYFGVGSLMVTSDSEKVCALNRQLREIFMNAMAELNINKKKVDRFEFKFKSVTDKSLPYYLQILKVVENNLDSFNFTATFAKPQTKLWKQYLGMVERIVPDSGRFMVIADYLHQPRGARSPAALENHESIEKILPIEGQGSIFLQLADICVGAVNFRLAGRKSRNKQKLAKKAIEILKKLEQKTRWKQTASTPPQQLEVYRSL